MGIRENTLSVLKKTKGIDFKVIEKEVNRANLYYTKDQQLESSLQANRKIVEVTIYKKIGNELGKHTFPLVTDVKKDIKEKIKDAISMCSLTKHKTFEIPKKVSKVKVKIADPDIVAAFKKNSAEDKLKRFSSRVINEFESYKNEAKLNSFEVFASHIKTKIENSYGLKQSSEETDAYIEMVVTAFINGRENEFYPRVNLRRLNEFKIKEAVQEYCKTAKDVLISYRPNKFKGSVILTGEAIKEFFAPELSLNPLVMHCFSKLKYKGMSRYTDGEYVTNKPIIGDKITIVSNPLLDYNTSSREFDGDGIPSKKLTLINEGRFKNYIAEKQYADYLGQEPSGPLGVIEIKPGMRSMSQVYSSKKQVYEIVSFSSFVPNELSGDFAAEIRLGYMIERGRKIPFKGGMFTGNVFDLFSNAFFSREMIKLAGYYGPKSLRFENATVAGMG